MPAVLASAELEVVVAISRVRWGAAEKLPHSNTSTAPE
jgi:hypothetical protein